MTHHNLPNSSSPATKLLEDIIWLIFTLSADMDSPLEYDAVQDQELTPYSALDTIRHASQVCHFWRQLLLRSPSIWGQVIRLDRLDRRGEDWRNEVMKRTGDAPLCVKGKVRAIAPHHRLFFAEFLHDHWSRLKKIDVRILNANLFDDGLWDTFIRPAPRLEVFKIWFEGKKRRLFSTEQVLFAGEAPMLRELHTRGLGFGLKAPWLFQLRSIMLALGPFTAHETLAAIKHTPLLEYLDLRYLASPTSAPLVWTHQSINLPHLTDLRLTCPFKICLSFADSIKSSDNCALLLIASDLLPPDATEEDLASMNRVIAGYADMFFTSRIVNSLSLNGGTDDIEAFSIDAPHTTTGPPSFCIDINCVFPPGAISSFLISFSKCNLSSITTFDFVPNPSADPKETLSDTVILFRSLPVVETLFTSETGLQTLLGCLEDEAQIFPFLRRLKLHYISAPSHALFDTISTFLKGRSDHGIPVAVMDISEHETGDWGFLEGITGLEVVWERAGDEIRYTCGSGEPEILYLGGNRY